jgi:hypothetical protein
MVSGKWLSETAKILIEEKPHPLDDSIYEVNTKVLTLFKGEGITFFSFFFVILEFRAFVIKRRFC